MLTYRKTGHIAIANHAWLHLLHLGMALYALLLARVDTRLGGYPGTRGSLLIHLAIR